MIVKCIVRKEGFTLNKTYLSIGCYEYYGVEIYPVLNDNGIPDILVWGMYDEEIERHEPG